MSAAFARLNEARFKMGTPNIGMEATQGPSDTWLQKQYALLDGSSSDSSTDDKAKKKEKKEDVTLYHREKWEAPTKKKEDYRYI